MNTVTSKAKTTVMVTCRVQNPDIHRAGRCGAEWEGAGRGGAERSEAGRGGAGRARAGRDGAGGRSLRPYSNKTAA